MNLLIVRRNQNVLNISRIGYKHILKFNDYITNFQMFVLNNMSEKNLYNKKNQIRLRIFQEVTNSRFLK